jgi:hypothetical protein
MTTATSTTVHVRGFSTQQRLEPGIKVLLLADCLAAEGCVMFSGLGGSEPHAYTIRADYGPNQGVFEGTILTKLGSLGPGGLTCYEIAVDFEATPILDLKSERNSIVRSCRELQQRVSHSRGFQGRFRLYGEIAKSDGQPGRFAFVVNIPDTRELVRAAAMWAMRDLRRLAEEQRIRTEETLKNW